MIDLLHAFGAGIASVVGFALGVALSRRYNEDHLAAQERLADAAESLAAFFEQVRDDTEEITGETLMPAVKAAFGGMEEPNAESCHGRDET